MKTEASVLGVSSVRETLALRRAHFVCSCRGHTGCSALFRAVAHFLVVAPCRLVDMMCAGVSEVPGVVILRTQGLTVGSLSSCTQDAAPRRVQVSARHDGHPCRRCCLLNRKTAVRLGSQRTQMRERTNPRKWL